MTFPLDCDAEGVTLGWQRQVTDDDKLILDRQALATFSPSEEKAALCKRPEEVDQDWLYRHEPHREIPGVPLGFGGFVLYLGSSTKVAR